jgi:tRNA(Ile2) C34 agmatinyltransferase TiaS
MSKSNVRCPKCGSVFKVKVGKYHFRCLNCGYIWLHKQNY